MFVACEKDDICIEESTPHLIIRFYDVDFPDDFKKVIDIKIEIEGVDGDYINETITTLTDSIAIPIKVTEDLTKFKLTVKKAGEDDDLVENEDVFELSYTRDDVFVSRSCGYKTLFYETTINLENDSDNWIDSIEYIDSEQNILNENSAHVKIFH